MSALNPNLERLTLHLCGQMESAALQDWSRSFKNLTRLELLAPFLVREEAWITFLQAKGPQLSGFLIINSPRFTSRCLEVLVESAVNLKELRLSEFSKIDDGWLEEIAQLSQLTTLELSYPLPPAPSLSSEAIIGLLDTIGSNLTRLDLSGNEGLEDIALLEGIAHNAESLQSLSLSLLPKLTDEGVGAFFDDMPKTARLVNLDLSRCHNLASQSLTALLKHSGPTLVNLNINGWKEVGADALSQITELSPRLVELDIGWCREANDLVMGHLMKPKTGKTELKTISCFACNRITRNCPKKVRFMSHLCIFCPHKNRTARRQHHRRGIRRSPIDSVSCQVFCAGYKLGYCIGHATIHLLAFQ
jgi:DNA repair protein RAD7